MKRVLRLFYGFQFFFSLLLWVPVFYEVQKRVGLSDAQIFGIQSLYYVWFCLFEIPTGFLADRWSHRQCMRLGALLLTVANVLPALAGNYFGFLAHFLLIALSRSLISGASSAYLYDYLKSQDALGFYKTAEGRARGFSLAGKVVFWVGVGALMNWHLMLPYWITAAFSLVSFVFAGMLSEPMTHAAIEAKRSLFSVDFAPLLQGLRRTPRLVLIMVQGIAIFVLARICQINLFQPILNLKSFPGEWHGAVMAAMTVFEAVGSAYPHSLRRLSDLNSVFVLTLVLAASLSGIAMSGVLGAIAGLCVFSWAVGAAYPIQRQLFNDAIPESLVSYRATLLSMESILDRGVNAFVAAVLGGFVAEGRVGEFLHLSAMVSVGTVGVLGFAFFWGGYSPVKFKIFSLLMRWHRNR